MITEQDLRAAIAECEGERNPNANTCIMLAAFYTIYEHMYGVRDSEPAPAPTLPQMSFSAGSNSDTIPYGNSEFAKLVQEKGITAAWGAVEELVDTVATIVPRLYDGFMRRLGDL